MLMRFRGGGVGHTSTRSATDRFLNDRDGLDQDNRVIRTLDSDNEDSDKADANEKIFDSRAATGSDSRPSKARNEANEAANVSEPEELQVVAGGGSDLDEEEDYGYNFYVADLDEDGDDSDGSPDDADDALGPEDGEGEMDEVNSLGFASF
jgi:hypothetical protein